MRLRFSNLFGTNTVELRSVHIALNPGTMTSSTIVPDTDKTLAFDHAESVRIPAGKEVWSDSITFHLPPLTNLAISIYFGETSRDITGHPSSRNASYLLPGNAVSSTDMAGAIRTEHWYNIEEVDVIADASCHTLVTLGDSITDGRGSTIGGNNRWPDALAFRLHTNAATAHVGIVNTGIGGNGIFGGLGPAAVRRFERDVLERSGVRWVILFEGVNDIGGSRGERASTVATNLIAAYAKFAAQAHARNLHIFGATITPFGGSGYYSELHEAQRQQVNAWLRTNSVNDGVIDFDTAVRDPTTPTSLLSACDSGDHLHLSPAGYQAMANAINLSWFTP